MRDRPTPETDAIYKFIRERITFEKCDAQVWLEHSQQLERERDGARDSLREWSSWCVQYMAERDEARKEIEIWKSVFPDIAPESVLPDRSKLESELKKAQEDATNYYAKIGELIEERDEAMETLREIAAADWKTSGELRGMAKKTIYR